MKSINIERMGKIRKEVNTINECIEICCNSLKHQRFADPLEGLQIIGKLMTRRRKACEKFLAIAEKEAPASYRIHKTLQGLEAQWG